MLAVEDAVSPLCRSLAHHNCSSSSAPISVKPGRICSSPVPIPSQRDTGSGCNSKSKTKHSRVVQPWGFPVCQSPEIVPGTVGRQKLAVAGDVALGKLHPGCTFGDNICRVVGCCGELSLFL